MSAATRHLQRSNALLARVFDGRTRRRPSLRLPSPGSMAGAGLLCLLLSACGSANLQQGGGPEVDPDRVFSAGFADLRDIYIEDLDIGATAVAGIAGLSAIDSDVVVAREGGNVVFGLKGKTSITLPAPSGEDAGAWGGLAADMVESLRSQSTALGATDSETIYETVFDTVVRDLDSFSRYSSRKEAQENRANRDGFGGIGVRIDVIDTGVKVLSVLNDTPAFAAGVKGGDIFVTIDGTNAVGMDQGEVIDRLRGPVGSTVRVGVLRDGQPLTIDITRAHIVPQTVVTELRGNVAVVRLSSFNHSTTETLREQLLDLDDQLPAGLAGIVLDLRGNPGGLLDQSVGVSDLFLSHGKIVTTHGRHRDSHQFFNADSYEILTDVPIVVLVNGNSASASEIVAAALQDDNRALVVGSVTYGKGTVQTVLSLPNEGELTLTWARFHAPSGYPLHQRGVLPDVCTSGSRSLDGVMAKLAQGSLPYAQTLRQATIDDRDKGAVEAFKANCPAVETEEALDLDVALRLIEDGRLYARLRESQAAAAE